MHSDKKERALHMSKEQLSQLSQEELIRLLEEISDSSSAQESHMDQVQLILDELDSRTEQAPTFDTEKGWESLQDNHPAFFREQEAEIQQTFTHKKHRKFRAAVILAAVLAAMLGTTVIAQAAGIDVFGAIARWTQDIFYFERSAAPAETAEVCAPLYEMLQANHIAEQLTPTWIPEGLVQESLRISDSSSDSIYSATYMDDAGNGFSITIMDVSSSNGIVRHEKDDTPVTVYTAGGIDHYFMNNINTLSVVWMNGNYECSISTNLPVEVVEDIIDSIYT